MAAWPEEQVKQDRKIALQSIVNRSVELDEGEN
jgi:hypothetical protein